MKPRQGTRQSSDRNFGIRSPPTNFAAKYSYRERTMLVRYVLLRKVFGGRIGGGRSESFPSDCLSKTQVPAQLARGCIGAEA